ncbi:hypothetical protein [Ferruginibacter sp. SUN106]|uniref:hypothetical protein n=1 Tax=Ferruginibacter sp. SUN106 TaxID=2978348 RepID=UPI003D36D49E
MKLLKVLFFVFLITLINSCGVFETKQDKQGDIPLLGRYRLKLDINTSSNWFVDLYSFDGKKYTPNGIRFGADSVAIKGSMIYLKCTRFCTNEILEPKDIGFCTIDTQTGIEKIINEKKELDNYLYTLIGSGLKFNASTDIYDEWNKSGKLPWK